MRNRHNKQKQLESPFEYLRRKDGSAFEADVILNWYKARAYVMDKLKEVAFGPDSRDHLHVVLCGDSLRMLSVARQVALSSHFANFDDEADDALKNRTVITVVSRKPDIVAELEKEEYLCNLPKYCKLTVRNEQPQNVNSYVDIEIRVVDALKPDYGDQCVLVTEEEVKAFFDANNSDDICKIDTRKAVLASRIYDLGTLVDNLPYEDIHNPRRYAVALDFFQYDLLQKKVGPLVNDSRWKNSLMTVKGGLSNVFCSDCFEFRAREVALCGNRGGNPWEVYNVALSKSEHARWVVDKLIMGFRPLNEKERYQEECLFGNQKKQYRKMLKNNAQDPVHIDLCSYRDLRRVDPDCLKYDNFLMLSIPGILNKVK